jgi:hypothetical protein
VLLERCVALGSLAVAMAGFAASPYDAPLKTRHVELKADPQNPQVKRQITCFYYRSVVIMQVDYGEVGAERLALLPVISGNATPCRIDMEPYEYDIPSDRWSGYFRGAKADYAFFEAPDGTNGGLGFMVLRVYDRKQLFDDTAQHGVRSIDVLDGGIKIRYQRVYTGGCSVITAGTTCRDALIQETGVSASSLSGCETGYERKWSQAPTVIVYEVEVILGAAAPVITRRSDALACHPSD